MDQEDNSNDQIVSLKKVVIQYSVKKHMLKRDWNEEEKIDDLKTKKIKIQSTTKKSVKFSTEVEEIPSFHEDIAPNTPDKPIISNEKRMRSCKEHMKTPYSNKRQIDEKSVDINDNIKVNSQNTGKGSTKIQKSKKNTEVDSPHFKQENSVDLSSENDIREDINDCNNNNQFDEEIKIDDHMPDEDTEKEPKEEKENSNDDNKENQNE